MALIEHFDREDWQPLFRQFFESALYLMKHDPTAPRGSAVDDLHAGLSQGGVPRVRYHLTQAMPMRGYSEEKQAEILAYLDTLAHDHRQELLDLIRSERIATKFQLRSLLQTINVSEEHLGDWLDRILAGERPFEEKLIALGYNEQDTATLYQEIDRWLSDNNLIPPSN
jgi:hypothetical protein